MEQSHSSRQSEPLGSFNTIGEDGPAFGAKAARDGGADDLNEIDEESSSCESDGCADGFGKKIKKKKSKRNLARSDTVFKNVTDRDAKRTETVSEMRIDRQGDNNVFNDIISDADDDQS